jgi:hypothetical protein
MRVLALRLVVLVAQAVAQLEAKVLPQMQVVVQGYLDKVTQVVPQMAEVLILTAQAAAEKVGLAHQPLAALEQWEALGFPLLFLVFQYFTLEAVVAAHMLLLAQVALAETAAADMVAEHLQALRKTEQTEQQTQAAVAVALEMPRLLSAATAAPAL